MWVYLLCVISIYFTIRAYLLFVNKNYPNNNLIKHLKKNRTFLYTTKGQSSVRFIKSKHISNKLLLTVHGCGSNLDEFKCIENIAIEKDFNYLSIDLYGRGLSNSINYNNSLEFENQIIEILNIYRHKYKLSDINVIGYSMGAIIINNIVNNNKFKFNSIILLSPVGLGIKGYNLELFKIKYLGELLLILFGDIYLLKHNIKCYNQNKNIPLNFLYYTYNHHGYLKSLLSTIRCMEADNIIYKNIMNLLVIYSKDDKVTIMNKNKFNSNCNFIELKKYGHSEILEPSIPFIFKYLQNYN